MRRVNCLGSLLGATRWWRWLGLWLGLVARGAQAAEYRPLPPAAPSGLSATDWLLYDPAGNRLILYLPGYHAPAHVYYQRLQLPAGRPLRLTYRAAAGLSIFLDNQLVFTAPRAGQYTLDLVSRLPTRPGGAHLLAVWQPDGYPLLDSFTAALPGAAASSSRTAAAAASTVDVEPGLAPRPVVAENAPLLLLLGLGLLYGVLRGVYPAGLARTLQVREFFSSNSEVGVGFLKRPAFTWLNLSLAILFAFSLALLLAVQHPNFSGLPVPLLRQALQASESALLLRVGLYAGLVLAFLFSKYLLIQLLSYVFDLEELANPHFREFLRTILLLGLLLPLVVLLHLGLNPRWSGVVDLANGSVLLLLTVGVLRVARTLHQQHGPRLNLHLLAYLCATEVLPLTILLKFLVFTYPAS